MKEKQQIYVVAENNKNDFEFVVREHLNDGFYISSTSVSSNTTDYDYIANYTAIMIKDLENEN